MRICDIWSEEQPSSISKCHTAFRPNAIRLQHVCCGAWACACPSVFSYTSNYLSIDEFQEFPNATKSGSILCDRLRTVARSAFRFDILCKCPTTIRTRECEYTPLMSRKLIPFHWYDHTHALVYVFPVAGSPLNLIENQHDAA